MSEAVVVLLVLVLAILGPIVLYVLVRDEHEQRERMDRQQAEQVARRDTGDNRK